MKRRHQSRPDHERVFAREAQLFRLEGIARGEMEPKCEREAYFQWTLQQDGRARFTDFILPLPLLLLEAEGIAGTVTEGDDESPNFTAPSEPAIPPA